LAQALARRGVRRFAVQSARGASKLPTARMLSPQAQASIGQWFEEFAYR